MAELKIPMKEKITTMIKRNLFFILIIHGVLLGILLGLLANYMKLSEEIMAIPAFLGEIMIRVLNMLILPLIICSTITGLANMKEGASSIIFFYSITYFLSTTLLASILGTTSAKMFMGVDATANSTIGEIIDLEVTQELHKESSIADSLMDIVRNLFPDNLISATFQTSKTIYIKNPAIDGIESSNSSDVMWKKSLQNYQSANIIGVIFFCGVFGSIVGNLENKKTFVDFFTIANEAIMSMIRIALWYTPVGVMCLLIGQMKNVETLSTVIQMLGWYSANTIFCTHLHGLIILPTIYFIFTRKNPLKYYKKIMPAMATAFGTDSSLMTLPVTKKCLDENTDIDKSIINFVLPIGTTINMDSATFSAAGYCLFEASLHGIYLGFGQLAMICMTSIVSSIGAVGLPSGGGMGITIIVLKSVNLPTEDIAICFAVDWFLGRFKTMINVLGDCIGCAIVDHMVSKNLKSNMEKESSKL